MTKKRGNYAAYLIWSVLAISVSLFLGWSWHSVPGYRLDGGEAVVEKAFYNRQSDLMVEVSGNVTGVIKYDKSNASYQEFRMRLKTGQLLTVVHRNSINGWVPLEVGDTVTVCGKYQWSELGGIIKGTQRDSSIKRLHGWIEHGGKRYD